LAYSEDLWREAKRKCRLNNEDVALAKSLGFNPKSLIKNIPSPTQLWKAPVKVWIHDLEAKRLQKSAAKKKRQEAAALKTAATESVPRENKDETKDSQKD
jgi:hypothetical protein